MPDLSLAQAQQLATRATELAQQKFGRPICVAVCDERGLLLAFARMDGAPARSVAIAQGKAYTAARLGVTTTALLERLHREQIQIGYFCDPILTALPGGTPIKDATGRLVGAVGLSGLAAAEDQQVTDEVASALGV